VFDYWTPERIAALTQPSSDNPPKATSDGAPWTGHNAVNRTVGRLFFTDHGEDVSCTATVVDSANRSTVVTAGHCVEGGNLIGEDHQWAANEMFVPGYRDGHAPYGKFAGRAAVEDARRLLDDGTDSRLFTLDQAFVVLGPNTRGQLVQDAVGTAQRIGFDRPGDANVVQFGYPRAASDPARSGLPEYTGERLAFCTGRAQRATGTTDFPEAPDQWGTACVMGGGSSGGPRVRDLNPHTGIGTVVGDNTHGVAFDPAGKQCENTQETGCTRYLVGTQFSKSVTKPLFDAAQHA
jgi:hypothetical protein